MSTEKPKQALREFMQEYNAWYAFELSRIPMFDFSKPLNWTSAQIVYFVLLFYHARGHFNNFVWACANWIENLWFVGEILLKNQRDEWGLVGRRKFPSHEKLYFEFAEECSVTREMLVREQIEGAHYLTFLQEFDRGHVRAIMNARSDLERILLFLWYENLDTNGEYATFLKFATERLGVKSEKGRMFFDVHVRVDHFEVLLNYLRNAWEEHPEMVRQTAYFIANHQLTMLRKLNDAVEAHK